MKTAEEYAEIIMNDDRGRIMNETSDVFESDYIRRIYEFEDGAVVHYEWRSADSNAKGKYNHRFTLEEPPKPNPGKFKKGVILSIAHSKVNTR